jgi:hypothetical protein
MNKNMMLLVFGVLLSITSSVNAAPDPQVLLEQSDHARGGGLPGITWKIQLNSRDGEKVDETQHLLVSANDEASVAEVIEPVRSRGTKLLQVGRNMWLTKPGLSKPLPISPRQRMSGQAANGDIAATNYAKDYLVQSTQEMMLEGDVCYVVDLKAKNNRSTYDKIRYWIAVKRNVGIKAEFYSVSGKLIKTAIFEYRNTIVYAERNIPFISKMIIRDALIDAETTMEFSAVKVKKIPVSEFDLGQLQ